MRKSHIRTVCTFGILVVFGVFALTAPAQAASVTDAFQALLESQKKAFRVVNANLIQTIFNAKQNGQTLVAGANYALSQNAIQAVETSVVIGSELQATALNPVDRTSSYLYCLFNDWFGDDVCERSGAQEQNSVVIKKSSTTLTGVENQVVSRPRREQQIPTTSVFPLDIQQGQTRQAKAEQIIKSSPAIASQIPTGISLEQILAIVDARLASVTSANKNASSEDRVITVYNSNPTVGYIEGSGRAITELTNRIVSLENSSSNVDLSQALAITDTSTSSIAGALVVERNLSLSQYLSLASYTPADTSNALYNVGGTLYWNGSAVGGSGGAWSINGSDVYRSTGNVGIGTSTPTSKLEVVGDITANGVLSSIGKSGVSAQVYLLDDVNGYGGVDIHSFGGGITGSPHSYVNLTSSRGNRNAVTNILQGDDLGMLNFYGQTDSGLELAAAVGAVAVSNFSGSNVPSDLYFMTNKTEKVRITSSGNVGVGTTSPLARLDVYGLAGGNPAFRVSSSTNATMFTVNANGNIGIGTTSPSALLELKSTQTSGQVLSIDASSLAGGGSVSQAINVRVGEGFASPFAFRRSSDNAMLFSVGFPGSGGVDLNNTIGALRLYGLGAGITLRTKTTVGGSTAASDVPLTIAAHASQSADILNVNKSAVGDILTINSIGNVGIGTSTPSYNFVVASSTSPNTTAFVVSALNQSVSVNPQWTADQFTSTFDVYGPNTKSFFSFRNSSNSNRQVFSLLTTSNNARLVMLKSDGTAGVELNAGSTLPSYINSGGNLGIGTTTPNYPFVVNTSSGASYIQISGSGSSAAPIGIRLHSQTGGEESIIAFDRFGNTFGTNSHGLNFVSGRSGVSNFFFRKSDNTALVTILDSGNVGISTTSPLARLSVKGGDTLNTIAFILTNSSDQTAFSITNRGQVSAAQIDLGGAAPAGATTRSLIRTQTISNDAPQGVTFNASHASGSLVFQTGSSDRMIINSSGNVGIGTTTPIGRLTISGSGPQLMLDDGAGLSATFVQNSAGLTIGPVNAASSLVLSHTGITRVVINSGNGNTAITTNASLVVTAATSTFSGAAGIGTTTPQQRFHVFGSGTNQALIESSNTDAFLTLKASGQTGGVFYNRALNGRAGFTGPVAFTVEKWGGNTPVFYVDSSSAGSGNVGIGTTTPQYRLSVQDINNAAVAQFTSGYTSFDDKIYSSIILGKDVVSQGAQFGYVYDTVTPTQSYAHITPFGFSEGEVLSISRNGNVGVGTTSPSVRLDLGTDYLTTNATLRTGSYYIQPVGLNNAFMFENAYFNGTNFSRANAGYSSGFHFYNGQVLFSNVPNSSGTFATDTYYSFKTDSANNGSVALGGNISTVTGAYTGASMVVLGTGNVGVGTTSPARKLHVYRTDDGAPVRFEDANGYCEINPTSTTWTCTSDERLKKDIASITPEDALIKMKGLRPVTFRWKNQNSDETRFGLIAQEVESLLPEFVQTDERGYKSVSYGSFTPIIISALQQLDTRVTELELAIASAYEANNTNTTIARQLHQVLRATVGVFTRLQTESIKTNGIEMTDTATGQIYCIRITSGEWNKSPGECANTNTDLTGSVGNTGLENPNPSPTPIDPIDDSATTTDPVIDQEVVEQVSDEGPATQPAITPEQESVPASEPASESEAVSPVSEPQSAE